MTLVERAEEMLFLENLLAVERSGTLVLIEGAATTGKTSLLHAFAGRAVESGAVFLDAAASRAERDLPLSAISQLFRGSALSSAEVDRAERLLKDGALTAMARWVSYDSDTPVRVPAPILSGLSEILLGVAARGPLVIGVDDIHHADVASLQFLLYLAHRTRSARVLLALTECLRPTRPHPLLHADLLRQPGARRLRLKPLSRQGVATVLAEHFDAPTARSLAADCLPATGGNPLLVHALIEDTRLNGPADPACLVFGDTFRQAVLTCLYRSESTAFARGIAVLGESETLALLGELVHLDAESIGSARGVLSATGLLNGKGFQHDAVQAAVLSGMRPAERTALHLRAAELLHSHGAPAKVVAERLIAADQAKAPWAVSVLRDMAEQHLAEGKVTKAIGCLRLAFQECEEEDQRLAVLLDLARAEWQIDPATATRHLPDLIRAMRAGRLAAGGVTTLVTWMLWLGRIDDFLETVFESWDRPQAEAGPLSELPSWLLRHAYPGLLQQKSLGERFGAAVETLSVPTSPYLKVGAMLASTLEDGAAAETLARAEQILQETGLASRTLTPLVAVAALIYIDELDRAERWSESLSRSAAKWPPLGSALFAALRAVIHARRGDLEAAEKCVHEAFTLITPKGWGVVIGIPLATMLSTLTAMGRYEEVENYLDIPVPEAMFHTPQVLPYLQARGRYFLAINRPQAALAEFQACGELMTLWGIDIPSFVSWRTDMAQAQLALGNLQEARVLAAEQLMRLTEGQLRTRGINLHTLAVASEIEHRANALRTAVELLERAGDRLELSRALADLSETYRVVGQTGPAKAMERRARTLAAQCGAEDVRNAHSSRLVGENERDGALGADPLTELSEAERRVAELAASGYTNRQIARRLHITVSTVEQHLTRVYRKLKISRRTDLPLKLLLPSQEYPA